MKPSFKCLYHLANDSLCIFEIKRTDLPIDAIKSDIYKWLMYNKLSGEVTQLIFNSSDASEDVQERYFDQGYLKFSHQSGTFIEKFNSAQHQLSNYNQQDIPANLMTAIQDFLELEKI